MHVHAKPTPQPLTAGRARAPKVPAAAPLTVASVSGLSDRGGGAPNRRPPRPVPDRAGPEPGHDAVAAFAAKLAALSLAAGDGGAAPADAGASPPGGSDLQALIAEALARP